MSAFRKQRKSSISNLDLKLSFENLVTVSSCLGKWVITVLKYAISHHMVHTMLYTVHNSFFLISLLYVLVYVQDI